MKLDQRYPTWNMPANYSERRFEIGPNGEKFSLLSVDSCYLLCQKSDRAKDYFDGKFYKSKGICHDDISLEEASKMMSWLNETLKHQSQDDSIVWKASQMHHFMFGASNRADVDQIKEIFLPLIQEHGYDVFFNGHEHTQTYSFIDPESLSLPVDD